MEENGPQLEISIIPKSPAQWIEKFLLGRGIEGGRPSGIPLYAYRCKDQEFKSLQTVLRNNEASQSNSDNFTYSFTRIGALFALYCAEWWRRYYKGGVWKWEPITSNLRWQRIDHLQRTKLVKEGLIFWRRDLITTSYGTQFLLSVACEGGLPVNVLETEGTAFRAYLRAITREISSQITTGLTIEKIAKIELRRLPRSWQQDQIADLAAQIVERVWAFGAGVISATDPIGLLNSTVPNWRSLLPLNLDELQADLLVTTILDTAKFSKRRSIAYPKLERFLERRENAWQLTAKLKLPESLNINQFLIAGSNPTIGLSERMEIYRSSGEEREIVARLTSTSNSDLYSLRLASKGVNSFVRNAEEFNELILVSNGQVLTHIPLSGGEELDKELPWCFVADDDNKNVLQYFAQGSVRCPAKIAYVASNLTPAVSKNDIEFDDFAEIGSFGDRTLWEISSATDFISSENETTYLIEVNIEDSAEDDYRLSGPRRFSPNTRFPLFFGLPEIQSLQGETLRTVSNDELVWRPIGQKLWQPFIAENVRGDIEVRRKLVNRFVGAWKVTVLPVSTKIGLHPITTNHGSINLTGVDADLISIVADANLNGTIRNVDDNVSADVFRNVGDVASVVLQLRWVLGGKSLIKLPFPADGAFFCDGDGVQLAEQLELPISRLYGVSARSISINNKDHYVIRGSIESREVKPHSLEYFIFETPIIADVNGVGQLPIQHLRGQIEQLLAVSTGLDDTVKLEIFVDRQPNPKATLVITRFEGSLIVNDLSRIVSLETNSEYLKQYSDSRLKMISINDSTLDPIELTWNNVRNGWSLPDHEEIDLTCSYFLVLSDDKNHSVRPGILNAKFGPVSEYLTELGTALTKKTISQRSKEIDCYCANILKSNENFYWQDLHQYLQKFSLLHPAGLDFTKSLIEFPELFASLWFRFSNDDVLIDYLEEICSVMPFSFWMIAPTDWLAAASRWRQTVLLSIENKILQKIMLENVEKHLKNLSRNYEEMNTIVDILLEFLEIPLQKNAILLGTRSSSSEEIWKKLDWLATHVLINQIGDQIWPKIQEVFSIRYRLSKKTYEAISWPIENLEYQKSVLYAGIVAAAISYDRVALTTNEKLALLAARKFHESAFSIFFRATQACLWVTGENDEKN